MNPTTDHHHPWRYPGVQAFSDTPSARRLFFGREEEASSLLYQLLADRFVIAFGRSGHGKSSLIQAGLMEELRKEGYFPFIARVDAVHGDPKASVMSALADEGRAQGVEYEAGRRESLWHFFKTANVCVDDEPLRLVLILDQFEELFTLTPAAARRSFADELADVVRGSRPRNIDDDHLDLTDRAPDVKVLVSMRGDYLWEFESLPRGLPEVFRSRFRVDPLRTRQARAAITEPSIAPGEWATEPFEWTNEAVDAMLDILGRKEDETDNRRVVEPFLLQVVCRQVEEQIARGHIESPIQLDEIGADETFDSMLLRYYEDCIGAVACDSSEREAERHRLLARVLCEEWLISPGKQRLSLLEEQIFQNVDLPEVDLDTLVDARLLTRDSRTGGSYYEISHDSLVEPILASRAERLKLARERATKRIAISVGAAAAIALLFFVTFVDEWRDRGLVEAVLAELADDRPDLAASVLNDVVNYDDYGLFGIAADWELAVGEVLGGLASSNVTTPSPSYSLVQADDRFLVTSAGLGVLAYDLASPGSPPIEGPGLAADMLLSGSDTIRVPRVLVARGDGTFGIGFESGHALLWRPGERFVELPRHDRSVRDLVFARSDRVATSDEGGTVRLAEISGRELAELSPVEGQGAYHLATHEDVLAVGTRQGRVVLLQLTAAWDGIRETPFERDQNDDRVEALEFDAEGRTLFARFRRTPAWLIDVDVAVAGGIDDSYVPDDRLGVIPSSAVSSDGRLLAVMTEADTLIVIDSVWVAQRQRLKVEHAEGTGAGFLDIDESEDRSHLRIVSARSNGDIRVWTMAEDEDPQFVSLRGGAATGRFLRDAAGEQFLFTYSSDGSGNYWKLAELALLLGSRDDEARMVALKSVLNEHAGRACLDDSVEAAIAQADAEHPVHLGFFHERMNWLVALKRRMPPGDPLDFCR